MRERRFISLGRLPLRSVDYNNNCPMPVMRLTFAGLLVFAACAGAATNPLLPLTAGEIRQAVRIVNSSGRAPAGSHFSIIALQEPPKESVLKQTPAPRRAFAVIYDYQTNQTFEAIANLTSGALDSWKQIPGARARRQRRRLRPSPMPSCARRSALAARPARPRHPRCQQRLWRGVVRRLFRPARTPNKDRIVREVFYYGGAGQNFYAHPVEGVVAHVDITTRNRCLISSIRDRDAPRLARECRSHAAT